MRGGRAHLFSDMVVYKLWWEKMDINFRNCREILTKDGESDIEGNKGSYLNS